MEIKLLNKNDMLHYNRLSSIAFTYSREPEKEEIKEIPENELIYGAFDESNLMAASCAVKLPCLLNGEEIKHFGVGGVATFPEYRGRGAIKNIFKKMLNDLYDSGYVLSSLMPFNHEFYRKYGYELCYLVDTYELPLTDLASFNKPIKSKMVLESAENEEFLSIYKSFTENYSINLACTRNSESRGTGDVWGGHFTKDRRYRYITYNENGTAEAYVAFTKQNEGSILLVNEMAFVNNEALYRLLGFLSGFYPHYENLKVKLPSTILLEMIIPDAYNIKKTYPSNYMHRVINVKKAIETVKTNLSGSFTLKIKDSIIEANNKTFEITVLNGKVACEETSKEADSEMNITSFTQLVCGAFTLNEVKLRADVKISGNENFINNFFTKKPVYIRETF